MADKNVRVYLTTYDGYIVVSKDGCVTAYEGIALCPQDVKEWLKYNNPTEIHEFYSDAIAYGYCK